MPLPDSHAPLLDAAPGDELRALLGPVSPEAFVCDYFARKPLFVKGYAQKYAGLFDRDTFLRSLTQAGSNDFLRASFDKNERVEGARRSGPAEPASSAFAATPEQVVPLFKAGATICATQMETRAPHLGPFAAAIKRQLGYPGRVTFNAYLSPPGAGFNWHWDGRIASTLQIEGTKRWRFSNSAPVVWPRGNGVLRGDGSGHYVDGRSSAPWEMFPRFDETDTTEVLLEPGDLLILPAGTWHDACGGEGGSLALNLSFTPMSLTPMVRDLLDGLLSSDPGWRGPGPLLPMKGGAVGEVEAAGLQALAQQLTRAADALRGMAADSAALVEIWSAFVQANGYGALSLREPAAAPVEPGDRLRTRSDGNLYAQLADGGSRLVVSIGSSGCINGTGSDLVLLQHILRAKSFVAADAATWLSGLADSAPSWVELAATLTYLLREGLLERWAV